MKTPMQNPDEFEKRLAGVPLRPPPAEWRDQILSAAISARPRTSSFDPRPSTFDLLRSLLWPHPAAWGALAAVWVCIAVLQTLSGGGGGQDTGRVLSRNWSEQRREVATMLSADVSDAPSLPQPRSERSGTNRNA